MKLLNKVISSNKINLKKRLPFYDSKTFKLSEMKNTDIILYELLKVDKIVNKTDIITLDIEINTVGIYSSFTQAYEEMKKVGMICLLNSSNKIIQKADYEVQELISNDNKNDSKIEYNYLGDRYIINKVIYKRDKETEQEVYKEHRAIIDFKEE